MARGKVSESVDFAGLIQPPPPLEQSLGTYPGIGVMTDLVESVADFTGDKVLTPLPNSVETLNLGTLHAPEGACLPFKLIMGSLMQSMARGANTPGMITERGPCRLGLYSLGMRIIFSDLGLVNGWFDFNNTSVRQGYIAKYADLYRRKYGKSVSMIAMAKGFVVGLCRLAAVEALEAERNRLLAYEVEPGSLESSFARGRARIRAAMSPPRVWWELRQAKRRLRSIPVDLSRRPVRVVLTGEVYCVIDPFANFRIESRLARLGAQPCRVLWQTDYFLAGMRLGWVRRSGRRAAIRAARAYLPEHIGGDCAANIGHAVLAHRRGDDGMIHLKPFACMLEAVAENLLHAVEKDTGFPILSLTLDDLSGEERLNVRLEAFVENLYRRRRQRDGRSGGQP